MIKFRGRAIVKPLLWVTPAVLLLAILRPWTIRPIELAKPATFDAGTFASSTWPRLVREATQTAIEISELAMPDGAATKARFVKGTGVVAAVDRRSRVGVLRVQLSGSRPGTAAIQIGPVIRGTALRDASSFIHFSDFTNQFDYAGAANALNDHALRTVVSAVPLDGVLGQTILFTGAIAKSTAREDEALEIVPVQLTVVDSPVK